jgi:hypothetical protein
VDFSEALLAVKSGQRVRRLGWIAQGQGDYLAYVPRFTDTEGRVHAPSLVVKRVDIDEYVTFPGGNLDLLAYDWELVSG